MSALTTHVLDTARGLPAKGVPVLLEAHSGNGNWIKLAEGKTDSDGRVKELLPAKAPLSAGRYRLTFDTGVYAKAIGESCFFPSVTIIFETKETAHLHVPLLLSPYGYSTYRGS